MVQPTIVVTGLGHFTSPMDPEVSGSGPLPALSLLSVVVMATADETGGGPNWAL